CTSHEASAVLRLFASTAMNARSASPFTAPRLVRAFALSQRLAFAHQPLIGTGQPIKLVDQAAHVSDLTCLPRGVLLDRFEQLIGSNLDGVRREQPNPERAAGPGPLDPEG